MARARILLADDHTVFVDGLKKLLEPQFEIVGAVSDGRELVNVAVRKTPDLVLLDISMPGLNGIEAALQLKKELPDTKIVFLTMHADPIYVDRALRAGAKGYLLKNCAAAELEKAIQVVLHGGTYVSLQLAEKTGEFLLSSRTPITLTSREREVLQLIAEGKSAKDIAAVLKISPKTVVFHKTNIMQKLGLRTTAELTRFSIRHGIVDKP